MMGELLKNKYLEVRHPRRNVWGVELHPHTMDEQQQVIIKTSERRTWWHWCAALVVVVAAGMGVYWWLGEGGSPEYKKSMEYLRAQEAAMKADTYGGKTPEETLKLFVAALKVGDVDLASKYFILDDSGKRDKWVARLTDIKSRGLMAKMAEDIETKAKPGNPAYNGDAKYKLYAQNGLVGTVIDLELNKYSGVWKIESL